MTGVPRGLRRPHSAGAILYDALGEIIRSGNRNIASIQSKGILPKDTVFVDNALTLEEMPSGSGKAKAGRLKVRRIWFEEALNRTKNSELVFLDPDNGFEPEKSCSEKHVAYRDISQLLDQMSFDSVISVFQHFRRKSFPKDYARIRERIQSGHSTAIYWHSLMFVVASKSEKVIQRVASANENYAKTNPVFPIS